MPDEEQAPQSQLLTQLGALASMVVHDMGSPLSASLLHASVLLRRLEREGADELVHEFRETLRVIDNVIRNALEAADRGGEWFLEPGVPSGTVVRIQLPVAEPE